VRALGDPAIVAELRPRMVAAARSGAKGHEVLRLCGRTVHLKYGPLAGGARWRYGLRAALGTPPPRLAEYGNLLWLRANGFGAPLPLAAGVERSGALPSFQFLATEEVAGTLTLRAFLEEAREVARRRSVFEMLGAEVARLHAAGFVHRDLFPRNLLVGTTGDRPTLSFLDAWRGGPGRAAPLRGPTYDLACLLLYLPLLASEEEIALLCTCYFERRGGARERTLRSAARQRRALVARLVARGRTDPPIPPRDWNPPDRAALGGK